MSVASEWGMTCPVCSDDSDLSVEVRIMAKMLGDGSTDADGDHEWDDGSPCQCGCGYTARAGDFKPTFTVEMLEQFDGLLSAVRNVGEGTNLEVYEANACDTVADAASTAIATLADIHKKLRILGFHRDEHIQAADIIEPITALYGSLDAVLAKINHDIQQED